jgi:hypothetical protein
MPIIVDEVVISVEVTNQASGGSTSSPSTNSTLVGSASTDERQAIVAECVERVLDILQQKAER